MLCGQAFVLYTVPVIKQGDTMTKATEVTEQVKRLRKTYDNHLRYNRVKDEYNMTPFDQYASLAMAVRTEFIDRWLATMDTYYREDVKRVYYLSFEFLLGRLMENNIINMGLMPAVEQLCKDLKIDFNSLKDIGEDAGLGNGGLGRLAACFLDSLATLDYPAMGYGIRYEYGIFRQEIVDGFQKEEPDTWLKNGNPWEVATPKYTQTVKFGGRVVPLPHAKNGAFAWIDTDDVLALPYDTPIVGYEGSSIISLRLWSAKPTSEFNLDQFNKGDYIAAVDAKNEAEKISKVLYPNDNSYEGKELRFKQQYFFVSASVQDLLRRFKKAGDNLDLLPDKVGIQLNDTHPALTILELMRLLIDQEGLSFEVAWDITQRTCAYTNHTLMPEALEKWNVTLFEKLLPRHLLLMYEINRVFLRDVTLKFHGDQQKIIDMSLFEERPEKMARMAYLSIVGTHSTNGVAALHSELLKKDLFRDFYQLYPDRFNNKTNGVTPRKWLLHCNPKLANLITKTIGDGWVRDLSQLKGLEVGLQKPEFLKELSEIKKHNKQLLAKIIKNDTGIKVDANSIFDVQIKRIHEYKRQLLNILHVILMYNRLKQNPNMEFNPMTVIFGGKAAPGYFNAKLIIKLINSVAEYINRDPETNHKLKVVFIPNYRISVAERLFPATDLSEQISTAGTEASGTGNMKFAMNGALTIGTMDGANVEMAEEIGAEHMFIFGLRAEEVEALRENKSYSPWDIYHENTEIKEVLDMLASGFFNPENKNLFEPIVYTLLQKGDHYLLLQDMMDYDRARMEANRLYSDQKTWVQKCLINMANMGKFSSDRTIHEYAEDIWNLKPVHIAHKDKK
jgi:starch phosphorylase